MSPKITIPSLTVWYEANNLDDDIYGVKHQNLWSMSFPGACWGQYSIEWVEHCYGRSIEKEQVKQETHYINRKYAHRQYARIQTNSIITSSLWRFVVCYNCWCNCNFEMYSLVYFMYYTPMFISRSICNVIESCHIPMFLSGDSIISHVKSLWVTLLLIKG